MPKVTQEHSDARRQQIIDAAYRCFAQKGFHKASIRDICAEAGLSAGAIYTYFKSKEDIVEASFAFDYRRSLPLFDNAAKAPDSMAAIDGLIDVFFAGLQSAAEIGADRVNIQGWGEALVNPKLMTPLRETMRDFPMMLARLIRRAQKAGDINPKIDADAVGQVIVSTYLGLYLQKAFIPELNVKKYRAVVHAVLHGEFAKYT
jgi:AcrR family transcriptional regulator